MTRFKPLTLWLKSVPTKTITFVKASLPPMRKQDGNDHLSHRGEEQLISVTNINPEKLIAFLNREFKGNYKIEVRTAHRA